MSPKYDLADFGHYRKDWAISNKCCVYSIGGEIQSSFMTAETSKKSQKKNVTTGKAGAQKIKSKHTKNPSQ